MSSSPEVVNMFSYMANGELSLYIELSLLWQTINLKNMQATPAAQFQKNKQPNQKMGQRTK